MGTISVFLSDGERIDDASHSTIQARLEETPGRFWLLLTAPSEDDLDWLGSVWKFHPLTLDDCRVYNPRPKLEEYPGYLFLVLHEVSLEQEQTRVRDIEVYFSKEYLITVQRDPAHVIGTLAKWQDELSRGTDYLLYRLLNALTEGFFNLVGQIDERIETVEEEVVARPGRLVLHRLFLLRKELVGILRLAFPLREVVHEITDREDSFVGEENEVYFRDVHSSLVLIHEMIETQRDLASGALETYLSAVSNNLNEVMKRLTLITTMFMPVSFIAAVGGMNFTRLMPFDEPVAFWAAVALMAIMPVTMLTWFRAKRWV